MSLTHLYHEGLFNPQDPLIFVVERLLSSLRSLTAAHSVLVSSLGPHCRFYAPPHNSHPRGAAPPLRTRRLRGPTLFFIFLMIAAIATASSLSLSDCLLGGKVPSDTRRNHIVSAVQNGGVPFSGLPFCFPFRLRTDGLH